jgi:hypothetical protein
MAKVIERDLPIALEAVNALSPIHQAQKRKKTGLRSCDEARRGGKTKKNIKKKLKKMKELNRWSEKGLFLPMDEHSAPGIQALLDEGIARGKVLHDVLVIDIVELDDKMPVGRKQLLQEGPSHRRDHVGDVGLLQGSMAAQGD